jgi:uncharacterized protein (DUF1778 family)
MKITVFFTALILMVSCQKKPVKHLMFRLQLNLKSDIKKVANDAATILSKRSAYFMLS